jgi:tetratricopeptide (TPR) repeat protein
VAERFEIERPAGAGGMGTVYRARELSSGAAVALKLLHHAGRPSDKQRFAREARVLSDLYHPGIVRYIAHGLTPAGEPYLAMEWLEGESLADRLAQRGMTMDESVALAKRVAEALGAAHERGIVHRDIKPANLLLLEGDVERTKLVDFGIARLGLETRLTRTDMFVGTPAYAAPEQARGSKQVDARADVFSLGCVLFECLTGQSPFSGDHVMAILAKILFEEAPHVSERCRHVPQALGDLVARMLSKEPSQRPPDGCSVAAELGALDSRASDPKASSSLRGSALTAGEQRLVSVILTGAVAGQGDEMMPTLTPAEVNAPFERLRAIAAPVSARVECLPDGSAIAALMGKGSATDQAVQAARCALALRAALSDIPIVLATGRSVVETRLLVGEAIDRAVVLLRAETLARSGGAGPRGPCPIFLDEVTAGLLEQRFEIGGRKAAPELVGERDAEEGVRTLLGKPTPCVGRERELAVLDGLFSECVAEPRSRTVLMTGPAGMGKSRLRSEFLRGIRRRGGAAMNGKSRVEVWVAQGDPLRAGSPFGMAAQLLRHAAGLLEGEPLETRRQKLRARVEERVVEADAARVSEFLGELLGTPFPDPHSVQLRAARQDPMLMGDQMKQAFQDFLAAECAAHPVLLVLEDLHWGDLASVKLVEAALRTLPEAPLMVLALARVEVHELFPKLWSGIGREEVRLGKLSRKASERLVRQVLGEGIAEETVARLVKQAAGNALYLEELIRAVAAGAADSLPGTVLAMVQSRLEALAPEARQLMRAGSVFGEVFWDGGASALLGGLHDIHRIDGWLEALADQELLVRRGESKFPGQKEYAFRHALVRDAAYAMLTEPDRALGHLLAGEWLERMGEQEAMVLAEHFERGGEKAHAATFYTRAAEQALEANDFDAVIARAERAASCGAEGELLGALQRLKAEVYFWCTDLTKAEECDLAAMKLLPPGSPRWFSAVGGVVVAAVSHGNLERLTAMVEELRAPAIGPSALAAQILVVAQVVRWLMRSGMIELAEPLFDWLADARDEVANDPMAMGHLHAAFALRSLFQGEPAEAHASVQASIANFERARHVRYLWARRMSAAMVLSELGAHAEAEADLRKVLREVQRIGLSRLAAVTKYRLGMALARRGTLEEARAMQEEAIAGFTVHNDPWYQSGARSSLALILVEMGRLDAAEDEARRAVELCGKAPPLRSAALAVLARVYLHRGRHCEASNAAQEAKRLLDRLGGLEEGEALVRVVFAEALHACGEIDAALVAIRAAEERLHARTAKIADPAWRRSFLEQVPENARTLELARQWRP